MKPKLITKNQRKMGGLPIWRKKSGKKRVYTRSEADETIMAYIE